MQIISRTDLRNKLSDKYIKIFKPMYKLAKWDRYWPKKTNTQKNRFYDFSFLSSKKEIKCRLRKKILKSV